MPSDLKAYQKMMFLDCTAFGWPLNGARVFTRLMLMERSL
jgi:hypothetical protein